MAENAKLTTHSSKPTRNVKSMSGSGMAPVFRLKCNGVSKKYDHTRPPIPMSAAPLFMYKARDEEEGSERPPPKAV
ncbi:unnamed protein product [Dibothriocephalus latus]|uniref:Uncharacterized protein n=1 Tax=Dibothriocephalus latus TaxID=60516 RepID=A0A3P6PRZ4_DIBLA|nr:unnamed protein product [Dibothriocephalus latus]